MSQQPSVNRAVHYVSHGTPPRADGSQAFASKCRAATVTEVGEDETVGLCVINPTGLFFHSLADGGVPYNEPAEVPGQPDCPDRAEHGAIFRYCACGWMPATPRGGTWHWPERV